MRFHLRACLLIALCGCSGSTGQAHVTARETAAPLAERAADEPHTPTLALAYRPTEQEVGIARAQTAIRANASNVDAYVSLAIGMMRRKRESSDGVYMAYAEDAVRAARSRAPRRADVLSLVAMIEQDGHRFEAARDTAREIVAIEPQSSTGYILLGDANLEIGEYADATEAYQTAINLRPDLRAYNRGAYLRWLHGDVSGSIELLEHAMDAGSPRDVESIAFCYIDLGYLHWHQGDARRALASADRALDLVPSYAPALALRGKAFAMMGDTEHAIENLRQATEKNPNANDVLELAQVLESAGRSEEALAQLRLGERLGRSDPRPLALYYARRRERAREALDLAEREMDARHNVEAYSTYALALTRAGRLDEASDAMDKALSLGTPDARLHLHRALLEIERGHVDAARAALFRAKELNPHVDPLLVAEIERGVAS